VKLHALSHCLKPVTCSLQFFLKDGYSYAWGNRKHLMVYYILIANTLQVKWISFINIFLQSILHGIVLALCVHAIHSLSWKK